MQFRDLDHNWRVAQSSVSLPWSVTLTAVRYQDEFMRATVRPYTGTLGPGALLVQYNDFFFTFNFGVIVWLMTDRCLVLNKLYNAHRKDF